MATNKAPIEIERASDRTAAEDALARADAAELHVLFERAQKRYAEMEDVLSKVTAHFMGDKDIPRYMPTNENAIAAMERIATEALGLARFVVEQAQQKSKQK